MITKRQNGFTLLEVIVALAITGVVLAGIFSLVGGSKQLSWRSEESLVRAAQVRAVTNFALLQNEFRGVEEILNAESYDIRSIGVLVDPVRKTQPMLNALQGFEVTNEDRDEEIIGSRWIRLNLPQ
ncbi:MAG: prepilin-type N-terminal cleavage/methylation domain-containing protein [Gammaproteobacteria bacterium]|nr:prepilin-type N-terminal cleavage/methylation domain-containing protein [Gammaproteobacteria bacterium]